MLFPWFSQSIHTPVWHNWLTATDSTVSPPGRYGPRRRLAGHEERLGREEPGGDAESAAWSVIVKGDGAVKGLSEYHRYLYDYMILYVYHTQTVCRF